MALTVNGKACEIQPGHTILQTCRANGIYIPTLCTHPRTGPGGRCRLCVVEIEGQDKLVVSCRVAALDGMRVTTDSTRVRATRRLLIDMLLKSGKHDCRTCETNDQCELQTAARRLGIRLPEADSATADSATVDNATADNATSSDTRVGDTSDMNESAPTRIAHDDVRCIKCGRCVTACNELVMHGALGFAHRGQTTRVIRTEDDASSGPVCVRCGECIQVCPTGGHGHSDARDRNDARDRSVEIKRALCPYCGVGCNLDLHVRDNRIVRSLGTEENWERLPNQGMLCVKGRFGLDHVSSKERLTVPLIRKNGTLISATWEEALSTVASRLQVIKTTFGPRALGFFSSAKTSNETNYAMMRLARGTIGTNNVDHCARLCHSSTVAALAPTLGSGAMTNSMQETLDTDLFLVTGTNTTWCHPVFGALIKRAVVNHGKKLIVVDPRATDLARIAAVHARQKSGSDTAWLMGLQHIIVRERWHDVAYLAERCEGWTEYEKSLESFTPERVAAVSGISEELLFEMARLFATAGRAAIYFGMGITQHSHGVDNVKACVNLALLTGNLGFPGGGVNPLRGQSNVQGACDMGALPDVFSGYQKVTDANAREKFARCWGIDPAAMDKDPGLAVTTMTEACGDRIKALYIMGENPMLSSPNLNRTEAQLKKLDFLVVQDIFLTETARIADVVLPGCSPLETSGSYTNTERRVQLSPAVLIPPGQARPDHAIIADIARRLGCEYFPATVAALFSEIKELTPSYRGMSHERIAREGLRWPCPAEDHPGTPILHVDRFVRGKALLSPLAYVPAAEEPDADFPLRLTTGRLLEHFHTGTMSRRSRALDSLVPHGEVEINPADAASLNIADGDDVIVSTRRGTVQTRARVTPRIGKGALFMAFHFAEAAANRLTNDALDPVAKIPEYKVCAARLAGAGPAVPAFRCL